MAYAWIEEIPLTGAVAMFDVKELLVAQGWTVLASGDGLALYGAASDVITTGAPGVNGMGNTKAWFRIEHPDGVREFTIQKSTNNYQYRIKLSFAAGFTGGTPGFDQTASAGDEVVVKGGGTDATPSWSDIWNSNDGSYWLRAGGDNAAPYNMWAYTNATGSPTPNGCLHIETLDQLQATDGDGTWFRGSTSNPTYSQLWLDSGNNNGFAFVPAVAPSTWTQYGAYVYYSDGAIVMPTAQTTNPATVQDDLMPIAFGRKSSAANPGYKGISTQMRWSGIQRKGFASLSTTPGAKDRIVIGDMNLPWSGTDPRM